MMKSNIKEQRELIEEYMSGEIKKIVLYDTQENLEKLEALSERSFVSIRDKGYTQLEPNTLTCVNVGILEHDDMLVVNHLSHLKLV